MRSTYTAYHGNDKEDQFLVDNFLLPDDGVFVDVGAGPNGIQGSNSYHFEKNGWKCICIDADPRNEYQIKDNRQIVYSLAVTNHGEDVVFNLGNESPDVSGILKTKDNGGTTTIVKSRKLYDILKENNVDHVDILSIDTEGTEIDAFQSINPKVYKPKFMIIEVLTQGRYNVNLQKKIENYGYKTIAQVGANLIFIYDHNHK